MTDQLIELLKHHYSYYVLAQPTISDFEYDKLEAEFMKTFKGEIPKCWGSDVAEDYPDECKS